MDKSRYYDLDHSHPIPNLDVVDLNVVKDTGGSDLIVIIASPLQGDERSLERLMRKLERYFGFSRTAAFIAESGFATVENTRVLVHIHPRSCRAAFLLLERSKALAIENDVTLEIDASRIIDSAH